MGGGDGHVIVDDATVSTLGNPLVSGSLPKEMQGPVATILANDPDDWTEEDRCTLGDAYKWALCNL
jgi:hypothetical protein